VDAPMQVVNCAAIAESLVEATLFGHVKGAFTGADETRPGVFELADRGTLFLDEVGELPAQAQAKLLRALEQGEFQRIGDNAVRKVDVRIIAATNRDLQAEVSEGRFREDLYHRLDVLSVTLPPLRERPGDLDLLIDHFLKISAERLDQPVRRLETQARALLLRYGWPGNVRQLRNTIERATIMSSGGSIAVDDLPEALHEASEDAACITPVCSLSEVERFHILRVLYAKLRQYQK
jgi:transcriptional regulator with PAS, ATPase and Fis domain